MAEVGPLYAVVALLEPGAPDPVRVIPTALPDQLDAAQTVGMLRAAAARLAQQHGLNGADCLRDFLATYPQPDLEGDVL